MNYENLVYEIMINQLPIQSDIIIVPGSSQSILAEKAAEIVNLGYSNKVMFTGGVTIKGSDVTEAEYLREVFIEHISKDHVIYIDKSSTNTYENAVEALQIINKDKLKAETITLVCKNYHSRRVLETFKYIFPDDVQFVCCTVNDNKNIPDAYNMMRREDFKILEKEYEKIKNYFNKVILYKGD